MSEKKYRGKPRVEVWVYGNDGMCRKFETITQCALEMQEHPVTIRQAAVDERITRKGYLYSFKQLTVNEVDNKFKQLEEKKAKMKKNQPKEERQNPECKEFIGSQEFTVDCFNRQVTYVPKTRQQRVNLLKKLIWAKLELHWLSIPTKVANLEKRAFQELLNSLE